MRSAALKLAMHTACWCSALALMLLSAIDLSYTDVDESMWTDLLARPQYSLIHRLETNKLRNVAKFFAHLLSNDAVSWEVFQVRGASSDYDSASLYVDARVICDAALPLTATLPACMVLPESSAMQSVSKQSCGFPACQQKTKLPALPPLCFAPALLSTIGTTLPGYQPGTSECRPHPLDARPSVQMQYVTLTEDATTSSSRIFLKTLFQDLSEIMGLIALNKRLQDPSLAQFFDGIFPKVGVWDPPACPLWDTRSETVH